MSQISVTRILPILTVLFLGFLGFSLAIPIFPPMFFDPSHSILPTQTTTQMRSILLGILFAMYPLGQLIGCPIMGKLSDKYGRKPILLISLLIIIPAYISTGVSVRFSFVVLLFISRFLGGLLEGNIVIAQAAVSDISADAKEKTKNFGWLISFSSLAFFIGPLLGGKLADSKLVSWFHFDTPFFCAAILVIIGFFIVYIFYNETHTPDPDIKIEFRHMLSSMFAGLKSKKLTHLFTANLLIYLSMFFFYNFFSAYLVRRFNFSVSRLGEVNAYLAIFTAFAPLLFVKFTKYFSAHKTLIIGSICLGISFLIFILPNHPWALFFTLLPVGFFIAIGFAFTAILISENVSQKIQGQALGTNQSIQVFGEAITALVGGGLMALFLSLPILIGSVCALVGGVYLMILSRFSPLFKQEGQEKKEDR